MQTWILVLIFSSFFINGYTQTTYTCSSNAPCGCSASSATLGRIVGGEAASSQTWGWAASLRYSSSGSHFCGGSIISEFHILTAAHCTAGLSSPALVRVVVGSIYLSSIVQERNVVRIYNHPGYVSSNYLNDIAILKLSAPLNLDQTGVDLVCLPNVSSSVLSVSEYPSPDTSLIAIGWGATYEGSQTVSSVLRQVTVRAVAATSSYCQNVFISNPSIQFCAGVMPAGGKDTCQGDSGGPLLMFTSANRWEQVGITSSGYGCARPNLPGIYTRVAAYQSWINETMNSAQTLKPFLYRSVIPLLMIIRTLTTS